MRSHKLLLPLILLGACAAASAQTYGLGTAPTDDQIKAWDIAIGPAGKELPPGSGSAKEGAALYMQKCAACHGMTGSNGPAPMLIKPDTPPANPVKCLNPCINSNNVLALHSPYATVLWDYINRGMPFGREGSLKPDEVYAITAYIFFKNGVVKEDDVLNAQTLPQLKMPNANGAAPIPEWKHGQPRIFPNNK